MAWLIDLSGASNNLAFEREETVTLEEERSVSMTKTTEIDVGVENETKIGGSMFGVELEDTLKESFNYKDTEEYNTASSHSTSTETSTRSRMTALLESHADIHRVEGNHSRSRRSTGRRDQFRPRDPP